MPAPPVPAAEAMRLRARRSRLRRRLMIGIWGVPLAFLAAALYFAFGPKPPPPPRPLPVSPQQTATASQHIDAVRQALTQAAPERPPASPATQAPVSPAPQGMPPPSTPAPQTQTPTQTLRVSQADLNTYLTGNTKIKTSLEAHGVHAATVELQAPSVITIHASVTFRGVSGDALMTAAMTPDPATAIHLDITDARFGRFPPPVIRAAASAILSQVLKRPSKPLPVTVQSVRVVGTDLVITETRRPPDVP